MGLSPVWLAVADRIGFEAFFAMWRILSSAESVVDDRFRIVVPRMSTYFRHQRNELIRALGRSGQKPAQIQLAVKRQTREQVSCDHIQRVLRRS